MTSVTKIKKNEEKKILLKKSQSDILYFKKAGFSDFSEIVKFAIKKSSSELSK